MKDSYMKYIEGHWLMYCEGLRVRQCSLSLSFAPPKFGHRQSVLYVAAAGRLNHIV